MKERRNNQVGMINYKNSKKREEKVTERKGEKKKKVFINRWKVKKKKQSDS